MAEMHRVVGTTSAVDHRGTPRWWLATPFDSSRFLSHVDQLAAVNQAIEATTRADGTRFGANVIITFNKFDEFGRPVPVGEGILRGATDYTEYTEVAVRIDDAGNWFTVVASTDEAIDVLQLTIKRRRLAAGIDSFDVPLQGIRSIDHASVQAQQDPTSRWIPDPNGGLLPDVGSERTLKRSMYATDRTLAHGPLSRDGYEPDAGSLEELLRALIGAARVMGVEGDTPESMVTGAAAMASLQDTPHHQWETLARLGNAVLEAIDKDHVIVHPG